jgi:thiol-disulfide isomerase/thioredoxin
MNRFFRLVAFASLTILSAMAVDVPRPAPEFSAKLPNGGQILLSKFRGKVVALEFLFTTCPHCQHASQLMSQLQTEYGPKGFQALGVAFNDMSQMLVSDFVRDFKVNYPVGFSTREPVNVFLQNDPNNALHVPQLVFIDRKGIIRHQSLPRGDSNTATETFMRKTIEGLLKEPAAAATKPAATKKPAKKAS